MKSINGIPEIPEITEIPEVPEVINCPNHGDYQVTYYKPLNRVYENRNCKECTIENEKKAAEKKAADEKALSISKAKQKKLDARINAGISKRNLYKTFDDYICKNNGQAEAKRKAIQFKDSFPCQNSLLLLGSVGTGKTLLASAILECLADDYRCDISKVIDIVRHIKSTWKNGSEQSEEGAIQYYISRDLLIIDEVGSQFGSDTEKLFIFDIIDGRYQEMKPTILISNLDLEGVKNVIGERCLDRLREGGGDMIAFDWESSRI